MKKSSLNKDIFRNIKKTFIRFLATTIMVALGSLVFVGIRLSGPNVSFAINQMKKELNGYDLKISSLLGFNDDDLKTINSYKNISKVEAVYKQDVFLKNEEDIVFSVFSLTDEISKPQYIEGKAPKNKNEIAVDSIFKNKGYKIGDFIEFEDESKNLKNTKYKISAFVNSIDYLNTDARGFSTIGDGSVDYFCYVKKENFKENSYQNILLTFNDLKNLDISSKKYRNEITKRREDLKKILDNRPKIRALEIKEDANQKIEKNQKKIDSGFEKLDDSQKKIKENQKKLDDAKEEYENSLKEFNFQISNAYYKIDDGFLKLEDAEKKLSSSLNLIEENQKKLKDAKNLIDSGKKEISLSKKKLNDAQKEYELNLNRLIDSKNKIEDGKNDLKQTINDLNSKKNELQNNLKNIENEEKSLNENKEIIADSNKKIDYKIKNLKEKKESLLHLKDEINNLNLNIEKLNDNLKDLDEKIENSTDNTKKLDELNNLKIQNSNLIDEKNMNISSLEDSINDNNKKIEILNDSINSSESEEDIENFKNEIENLNKTNEDYLSKIDLLKNDLSKLENDNKILDEEIENLKSKDINYLTLEKENLKNNLDDLIFKKEELQKKSPENLDSLILEIDENIINLENKKVDFEVTLKNLLDAKEKISSSILQIDNTLNDLNSKLENIKDSLLKVEDGFKKIEKAKEEISNSKSLLYEKESELNLSIEKYKNGEKELLNGIDIYNQGKANYENSLNSLIKSKNTLEEKEKKGKIQLENSNKKINEGIKELNKNKEKFNKEYDKNIKKLKKGQEKIDIAKDDLKNIKPVKYSVDAITDNSIIAIYLESANNLDMLSFVFPTIFYLIALLVSLTSMTRMVNSDRSEIGTYKALGYKNFDISKKYLVYGILVSIFGAILGGLFGYYVLMPLIFKAYFSISVIKEAPMYMNFNFILISLLLNIICTVFAAYIAVKSSLKEKVSQLLRPKPPKDGNRTFIEKVKFIWEKLPFLWKVTLRNIFRYKNRMFMTLFGVCGCTALITMGFGIKDSVSGIMNKQFSDVWKFDVLSVYNPDSNEKSLKEYNSFIENTKNVKDSLKVFYDSATILNTSGLKEDVSVIATEDINSLEKFVSVRDRKTHKNLKLKDNSVIITEKLSKSLNKNVGDTIKITDSMGNVIKLKIKDITENYVGHFIYMSDNLYRKKFDKADKEYNADFLKLTDVSKEEEIAEKISNFDSVISTMSTENEMTNLDSLLYSLNFIVLVIVFVSSGLALVVLYNLTDINVDERKRELSTIKVLGFKPKEITLYIYRETLILSVMGILLGFVFGRILHLWIVVTLAPTNILLDPVMNFKNYFISMAITIFFILTVMFIVHEKLKKIDMVESLKTPE
ncbi:MAG: FtsX-like permease family protein [Peptoniphilaceae bacterium]|nr:FtsX-like permease family protein [Peptoniphilaceae bacterium]MDD7383879.1 FtsX-like permease family protein [Peptoniphilaceae bacterium]MDY3738020.1 FtsX-like permease family protein [Peptoniphilaceae bacterium]